MLAGVLTLVVLAPLAIETVEPVLVSEVEVEAEVVAESVSWLLLELEDAELDGQSEHRWS